MKYFISIIFSMSILVACNQETKNIEENINVTTEINKIDSVTTVIEQVQTEIELRSTELDAALSELDF